MGHGDEPNRLFSWFEPRILNCLKLRPQDLKKLFEVEENKNAWNDFLEGYDCKKIYIFPGSATSSSYIARPEPPENLTKKGMYFIRTKKEKLDSDIGLRNVVQFGDLYHESLTALDLVSKTIFSRLIKSRGTSAAHVPAVYRASLSEKTDAFASQLLVATGLGNGKTLLPIPLQAKLPRRVDDGQQDKELVFIIENAVATWTPQIRAAINAGPEELHDQALAQAEASAQAIEEWHAAHRYLLLESSSATAAASAAAAGGGGGGGSSPPSSPLLLSAPNSPAPGGQQIHHEDVPPVHNSIHHPGPVDEIKFWSNKAENLEFLEEQLFSVDIAKMTVILKKSGSSYYPAFHSLIEEVGIAASEARDNYRFLKPLQPEFELMVPETPNYVEFNELGGKFKRLFHFLSVIWQNSSCYNTPRRMVVLIRELANDLIASARENIRDKVNDILNSDNAEKTITRLSEVLHVCGTFKEVYFKFKAMMNQLQQQQQSSSSASSGVNPWSFQNVSLFQRLDAFLERCHDVVDILETVLLFKDMDKMKVGGAVGIELSAKVEKIRADFFAAHSALQNSGTTDFLDIDDKAFERHFAGFIDIVKDLELQLGTIMSVAVDESRALTGLFKVVDTFEGFTDRQTLSHEWNRKQFGVLKAYHADLLNVQELFNEHKAEISNGGMFPNLPPTVTALVWSQALIDRIDDTAGGGRVMSLFTDETSQMTITSSSSSSSASAAAAAAAAAGGGGGSLVSTGTAEGGLSTAASRARAKLTTLAQETELLRNSLLSAIRAFKTTAYGQWRSAVEGVSTEKLKLNLLSRSVAKEDQGALVVNFDPELTKALREVHYLTQFKTAGVESQTYDIPSNAAELNLREETLREQVMRLDYVANTYNRIMATTRAEDEKPLLRDALDWFEHTINQGLSELTWNSGSHVGNFVDMAAERIRDIDEAVSAMHGNVEAMRKLISDFTKEDSLLPFSHKKGDKIHPEHDVRKRLEEHIKQRKISMRAKEAEMKSKLEKTFEKINELKNKCKCGTIQNTSPVWVSYVEYVNSVVGDALCQSVVASLQTLKDQLDPNWIEEHEGQPLMEIKLSLSKPHKSHEAGAGLIRTIRFEPALDSGDSSSSSSPSSPQSSGGPFNNTLSATAMSGTTSSGVSSGHVTLESFIHDFASNVVDSAANISRLEAIESSHTYLLGVENSVEVQRLFQQIAELVHANNEQCRQFLATFAPFSNIYQADMRIEFQKFLRRNRPGVGDSPTAEEAAAALGGEEEPVSPSSTLDVNKKLDNENYFGLPLDEFHHAISHYERTADEVLAIEERRTSGFLRIDAKPIRAALSDLCRRWKEMFSGYLFKKIESDLEGLDRFVEQADQGLDLEVLDGNLDSLKAVMRHIRNCRVRNILVIGDEENPRTGYQGMFPPIHQALMMLKTHPLTEEEQAAVEKLDEMRKPAPDSWINLNKKSLNVRAQNSLVQDREAEKIKEQMAEFEQGISQVAAEFRKHRLFFYKGVNSLDEVYDLIDEQASAFRTVEAEGQALRDLQELFDLTPSDFKELRECKQELAHLKQAWDLVTHIKLSFQDWLSSSFSTVDVDALLDEIRRYQKQLRAQPLKVRGWDVFKGLEDEVKNMYAALPLCSELRSNAMRERHWKTLLTTTQTPGDIDPDGSDFTLQKLIDLGLHRYVNEVGDIVETATKQQAIERSLVKIVDTWEKLEVGYTQNETLQTPLIGATDEIITQLEVDNASIQSMLSNRFVDYFLDKVVLWQKRLSLVESSISKWTEIQRQWLNLWPIFVSSSDIKGSLAEEVRTFNKCDELFRAIMQKAQNYTNVIELICTDVIKKELNQTEDLEVMLESVVSGLKECERGLNRFLARKREIFARFFFVSSADLIDILSKGNDPEAVMIHMGKIIDSVDTFVFRKTETQSSKDAYKMISKEGEEVLLAADCTCEGPVEDWMRALVQAMKESIKHRISDAYSKYHDSKRTDWIKDHCCQAVIVARRMVFTADVTEAFSSIESGSGDAMKEFQEVQETLLKSFIAEVGPQSVLTENDRAMLKHLITIEVHNRDIVSTLVSEKGADSADCFTWQNQLRYEWDIASQQNIVKICDYVQQNDYEYIGLCGCLVITKLTDRCYITLTQALRLFRGGAPAGPAGTGKTETTKDLARNLGMACYVFNCSSEMTYITLGQIFKGLAMSGAWGCFDEFNRISIEVLSVVATQVGSILNALRLHHLQIEKEKKLEGGSGSKEPKRFRFMGGDEEIPLVRTVGIFITMNPGYAGRTELPENIKSLFRPCAMVVPDLQNICEIMLAAEGFEHAKDLALKFVTLYRLNKDLLSPQKHYDWGLRAVKSVLYIAGSLRRQDPETSEKSVLMRALRDTNLAKLSKDDVYVFSGLIQALFPKLEVPKKPKEDLADAVKQFCKQTENRFVTGENDIFVLKCLQYEELLHVRHSVFILGPAGCGKTSMWRSLQGALRLQGDNCTANCLNPKAITTSEMYGYFFQKVDWRDGILSAIFRELSFKSNQQNKRHEKPNSKWIVLDGIIDAEWIESMNTVMDDNKVLTLVSNDRIPLSSSMRMIFEVSHLNNASPATVSRAGVVFINESDLGWFAFKERWTAFREDEKESVIFDTLFDRYVQPTFDYYHRYVKPIITIMDIGIVTTLCNMLEGFLQTTKINASKLNNAIEVLEKVFVFCVIWSFGGTLPGPEPGRPDARVIFSNWWRKEFPLMKMSDTGTVFDFFLDQTDYEWKPWSELVEPYRHDPEAQLSNVSIQTADTIRMRFLMSLFMDLGRPVMLVGTSGTGKTNLIRSKLADLDKEKIIFRTMSFNARTGSAAVQTFMEQNLEKRTGRTFGPPNRKKLVVFFDDMNMQQPDKYGTQDGMAFVQQHLNYGFWYDKENKLKEIHKPKEIVDVRYVGAMNPKSGSFTILDRVLRYFAVFATIMPDTADLTKIYGQILEAQLTSERFSHDSRERVARTLTKSTIELHQTVIRSFFPTAIKFHYQWNMRELFNIFQGICKANQKLHDSPVALGRVWYHEVVRTFRDRMPDQSDLEKFDGILAEVVKAMPDMPHNDIMGSPHLYAPCRTTKEGDEGVYDEFTPEEATQFFISRLEEYNESYPRMDLVLFQQAVEHICRIARVIANPRGNALLVGVGGSGKQSLARLATYIMGQEPFQIVVSAKYTIEDFRVSMQDIYRRTGVKGQAYTLIITDGQIVNMDMLVYLNDMLSNGNVPELFVGDDRDNVISSLTSEVKLSGEPDYNNPDVVWAYFINKVRTYFHIILCFSPKSRNFASWCRQFPALAGCCVLDWYHDWPEEALRSVSYRFLSEIDLGGEERTRAVSDFMAGCQGAVLHEAEEYFRVEKRRCYSTPKSFLELISLYKETLAKKREALEDKKQRLARGIEQIKSAGSKVADMQETLKIEQEEVEQAKSKTTALMEYVGGEKAKVQEQNEFAENEAAKNNKIVMEVENYASESASRLAAARPLVDRALAALTSLDKNDLAELKALGKPPDAVCGVIAAVKILTSDPGKIPPKKSRSNWNEMKRVMGQNVVSWKKELEAFNADEIPQVCVDEIMMYIDNPEFDPQSIKSQSKAASGLCAWVRGIQEYHVVRCQVRPLEQNLQEAQERLALSKAQLKKVEDKRDSLRAALDVLIKQYNDAVESLNTIEAKAKKTRDKIDLAQRLVGGLSSENKRWGQTIIDLEEHSDLLVGNVLLASAFVSYVGPFSKAFRERIVNQRWRKEITELEIPITKNIDIVYSVLTDESSVAQWNNEGLPTDRVSTENAAIALNSSRWPLMIDPQLQGARWIRTREEKNGLRVIQCNNEKWTTTLIQCIEEGLPCLIESLPDHLDPVLDNILGRNTYRKGAKTLIKLGNQDVTYNSNFKLYLQTRLPNPFYKPEVNAQTTLINFMVTESGLEDQLLAVVVNHERPELEKQRSHLIRQMNIMTIELHECEDNVLSELSNAQGDPLENIALVENLEATKKKAGEITKSMEIAVKTKQTIAENRAQFQSIAFRGALLFFQIDNLAKIDHMYQYSLEAFMAVFNKALDKAPRPEDPRDVKKRVDLILQTVTETLFAYVARGLFERHKLIFSSLLCFTILSRRNEIDPVQLDFLLRGTKKFNSDYPENIRDFISEPSWQSIQALSDVAGFEQLPNDLDHSRWRAWMELEKPEEQHGLPLDYKNLSQFQRLLVLRCLRPDRLTAALEQFVSECMGKFFVTDQAVDVALSFQDSGPTTPLFFILSPGVDPVRYIEALGEKMGITYDSETKRLHNVSLGQGQEPNAMEALDTCFEHGGWALLSNIHLVESFVKDLEKKFEQFSEIYTKMGVIAKRKAELKAARRALRRQQRLEAVAAQQQQQPSQGENSQEQREGDDEEREEGEEGEQSGENNNNNNNASASATAAAGGDGSEGENNNNNEVNASSAAAAAAGDAEGGENSNSRRRGGGGDNEDEEEEEEEENNEGYSSSGAGLHNNHEEDEDEDYDDEDDDDEELDEELEAELHMEEKPGALDFRVFLTAEPSDDIPIGILQRCIKLTSEPPTGIQANVLRALANFSDEPWDSMTKPNEYRAIMFAMCWFHAVVVERKKFGAQGWNRVYPYNAGDLTTCLQVTDNFITAPAKVPWEDLRYVFGEIMYGGHITDDWDRALCMAYLRSYIVPDCLDGLELTVGFQVPGPMNYSEYVQLVNSEIFPVESPVLYGLHPNAEINFRTNQADVLFRTIADLQPAQVSQAGGLTRDDIIREKVIKILDHLPEMHNMGELTERLEDDRTPQQHVFYQECERMNILTKRVRITLSDLKLGLEGALSISPAMQLLADELFMDRVPEVWKEVSFLSMRGLLSWFENFNTRNAQLMDWEPEMVTPKVTMLSFFFNPMSFLTAIMQKHSMDQNLELDKMTLHADVSKKAPDSFDSAAREGAHVAGLVMEGARWDNGLGCIEESRMKDLYPKMPVITIKSIGQNKLEKQDMYECPIYKTQQRGPGFVTSLFIKSKRPARHWTIAGVAMLLDVVDQ